MGTRRINHSTVGTCRINYSTVGIRRINYSTVGTRRINYSTVGTRRINYSTVGPRRINYSTVGPRRINYSTVGTRRINYSTVGTRRTGHAGDGSSSLAVFESGSDVTTQICFTRNPADASPVLSLQVEVKPKLAYLMEHTKRLKYNAEREFITQNIRSLWKHNNYQDQSCRERDGLTQNVLS